MATETKTFYPGEHEGFNSGDHKSISDPMNPVGKGTDNNTYAYISAFWTTAYAYWPFDVSIIPDNATIDSVECKAKVSLSNDSLCNGKIQLFSGDIAKGIAASITDTRPHVYKLFKETWTRSELNSVRLKTSIESTKANNRSIRIYGADLTVTYTYQSQKFMLKTGGAWADVARVFKKVSGIWVEQTELSGVVEDGVRYANGGEYVDPVQKRTVTITGTGDNSTSTSAAECYVQINGVKYVSPTTVEVDSGTTMLCYAYAASQTITLNGSNVGSGTPKQYTHTINDNCNVALSVDISMSSKATITITTQ